MSRWGKGGVLVSQMISSMIEAGRISSDLVGVDLFSHVQPASLDLPIGDVAFEMRGVVLPKPGEKISDLIKEYRVPHVKTIDLTKGAILERESTYLIRSAIKLRFHDSSSIQVEASPKSSIGRIDLHTRTVCDGAQQFDTIPMEYEGYVYMYVVSNSFRVYVETGIALMQLRFRVGEAALDYVQTKMNAEVHGLVNDINGKKLDAVVNPQLPGVLLTLDLKSYPVIGYFAKHTHTPVFLNRLDNPWEEFWEPIPKPKNESIHVPHGKFGIFVTKEYVSFPAFVKAGRSDVRGLEPGFSGVMMIYDPTAGEFRAHYAGFFDPGFGCSYSRVRRGDGLLSWKRNNKRQGMAGVLEIRCFEKDRILRHGDPICRMVYEKLMEIPDIIYGMDGLGSNYRVQTGAKLAKFFK